MHPPLQSKLCIRNKTECQLTAASRKAVLSCEVSLSSRYFGGKLLVTERCELGADKPQINVDALVIAHGNWSKNLLLIKRCQNQRWYRRGNGNLVQSFLQNVSSFPTVETMSLCVIWESLSAYNFLSLKCQQRKPAHTLVSNRQCHIARVAG